MDIFKHRSVHGIVGGAAGGFTAWLVMDVLSKLGRRLDTDDSVWLLMLAGAVLGVCVGGLVGLLDGVRQRALKHGLRSGAIGAGVGMVGGALGFVAGGVLFNVLGQLLFIGRPLGLALGGAVLGSGQGAARASASGTLNAAIGGVLGGVLGGLAFDTVMITLGQGVSMALPRGIALIFLGAFIGLLVLVIEKFLAKATLKVTSGKLEGREFLCDKPELLIGRDERCDVPLYYDRDTQNQHAVLNWEGGGYRLRSVSSASVLVEGQPINDCQLRGGEMITVGGTRLIYRLRGKVRGLAPGGTVVCSSCRAANRDGAKFCSQCGGELVGALSLARSSVAHDWFLGGVIAVGALALFILLACILAPRPVVANAVPRIMTVSRPTLAVTPKEWDNIGAVLGELGDGYEYTKIGWTDLGRVGKLKEFEVVFVNCSARSRTGAQAWSKSLRQYVEDGGALYASDWALELVASAFPEYVRLARTRGAPQEIRARVTDADLEELLGGDILLHFDADDWYPIGQVSSSVKIFLRGTYRGMSGRVHRDMPLLVTFRHGKGFVICTAFHNKVQLSEEERKLVRFLVERPVTFTLFRATQSLLGGSAYKARRQIRGTLSQGDLSRPYLFSISDSGTLEAVLNWKGYSGDFEVILKSLDGSVIANKRGGTAPLTLELSDAVASNYTLQVRAHETPYTNTPFVLGVGVRATH